MTEKERLFLANQYLILSKLDENNAEHYKRMVKVVEQGYEYDLNLILDSTRDVFPDNKCRFTLDVLQMYFEIISSYEELKRNNVKIDLKENDIRFPGFDGNKESEYLCYAIFVLEDPHRFDYIKKYPGDDNNSHYPTIERYKRSLVVYNEISQLKGVHRLPLSEDEINRIIKA